MVSWWMLLACGQVLLDNPAAVDLDGDGVSALEGDCDDQDPDLGAPVTGCTDLDGDGWALADGDCDDGDPTISPAREEICGDGVDQDCDTDDPQCGAWGRLDLRAVDITLTGPAWPEDAALGVSLAIQDGDRDGSNDLLAASADGVHLFSGPLDDGVLLAEATHLPGPSLVRLVTGEGVGGLDADGTVWWWPALAGTPEVWSPGPLSDPQAARAHRADLDGDGETELLFAHPDRMVWLDGHDPRVEVQSALEDVTDLAARDVDADGHADLLVVRAGNQLDGESGEVLLLAGPLTDGSDPIARWTSERAVLAGSLAATADLADGRFGLVVTDEDGALWQGDGEAGEQSLTLWLDRPTRGVAAAPGPVLGVLTEDEENQPSMAVFHGPWAEPPAHPDAWFELGTPRPTNLSITTVALGDLDGDGRSDVAVGAVDGADGAGRIGVRFEGVGP